MSNEMTQTKIKDAFRELTIKNSFAKVKVADIIAKAGISRMTFYRHYLDKYALLEEVCFDDFNSGYPGRIVVCRVDVYPAVFNRLVSGYGLAS